MKQLALAVLVCAAVACEKPPPMGSRNSTATGEPARIRVQHVLVSFRGSDLPDDKVSRTQDEAEVLARELVDRARRGEDFKALIKKYSNDTGDGDYTLVNHGVVPHSGDRKRGDMVAGFADMAFSLKVGDVGLTPYDKTRSPYGYHVIKRIE